MSAVAAELALPKELTLRQASSTLAQLRGALAKPALGAPVCVQAKGLEVFDSSALAVLLELRRAAVADGRRFVVAGLPPALRGLATLYGVEGLLTDAPAPATPAG